MAQPYSGCDAQNRHQIDFHYVLVSAKSSLTSSPHLRSFPSWATPCLSRSVNATKMLTNVFRVWCFCVGESQIDFSGAHGVTLRTREGLINTWWKRLENTFTSPGVANHISPPTNAIPWGGSRGSYRLPANGRNTDARYLRSLLCFMSRNYDRVCICRTSRRQDYCGLHTRWEHGQVAVPLPPTAGKKVV